VNRFIEECRREWKRLHVPDAIANEMAADLAADLAEAEAEGASAEDVLGEAVFDARSFAATWAEERGVITPAPAQRDGRTSVPLVVVGAVLLATAIIGAALVVAGRSGSVEAHLAIAPVPRPHVAFFRRPGFGPVARVGRLKLWHAAPPFGQFVVGAPRDDTVGIGFALLIVGLTGSAVVAIVWLTRRARYAPA